jgi:hypothetical protein
MAQKWSPHRCAVSDVACVRCAERIFANDDRMLSNRDGAIAMMNGRHELGAARRVRTPAPQRFGQSVMIVTWVGSVRVRL